VGFLLVLEERLKAAIGRLKGDLESLEGRIEGCHREIGELGREICESLEGRLKACHSHIQPPLES
jgi:hypothetical protein